MRVDLVIPFFNEEENLQILVKELNKIIPLLKNHFKIIFVNDGSSDQSEKIVRDEVKNILFTILKNEKNVGQTLSFQKAFDASNGDFIIRMDSDLQDDPSDLIKFDSKINSQVDIILGYRAKRKHNIILKLTTSVYDKLVSFIGISNLPASSGSFVGFKSDYLKGVELKKNDHRYLPIIAQLRGAKNNVVIDIKHRKRIHGKSNYNTILKVLGGTFEFVFFIFRVKKGYYSFTKN